MFWVRLWLGIVLSLPFARQAFCDTPCPTVSSQVQILNPTITGAPMPIALASYDLNTNGLTIQWSGAGNKSIYFVGVPRPLIVGKAAVPWTSISSYPQALVQEQSVCPILSSAGTPVITTNLSATVASANIQNFCPLVSDGTQLSLAAISFPPYSIYAAIYDAKTQYLSVQFAGGATALFVGVPKSVGSSTIEWNSLYQYTQAIMTQQSACPVLSGGAEPPPGWTFGVSAFGIGSF